VLESELLIVLTSTHMQLLLIPSQFLLKFGPFLAYFHRID
jgi:hypothetical protein